MNSGHPVVPPAGMRRSAREPCFSLSIALVMLAAIGLASAAIMRNATSADQVANGNRLQTQARQYAQLALRLCESQLALAPSSRSATLQPAATPAAWTIPGDWAPMGAAHMLAPSEVGSAVRPRFPPHCLMEATTVSGLYTITARGFSPDYRADPRTGATRNGSAVWLQATIHAREEGAASEPARTASDGAPAGALTVRQRVWQQLLTPPF
jgi:type IV pilus assembly protein PilX